jgi:hypothetical protein
MLVSKYHSKEYRSRFAKKTLVEEKISSSQKNSVYIPENPIQTSTDSEKVVSTP